MQLLTTGDAARELGISVEWLRKLEREGKIPKAKRLLNRRRVYVGDDLEHLKRILIPALSSIGLESVVVVKRKQSKVVKKQGERNQRLAVNVRHVTASDADARLSRVIDILLRSAEGANQLSGESVVGSVEEEPSGQASVEDTATLGSDADCPIAEDDPNREHY